MAPIMGAKARNAGIIIGVDVVSQRLELASSLGATHTMNSVTGHDVVSQIKNICAAHGGVQHAIDATGISDVVESMIDSLAPKERAVSSGPRRQELLSKSMSSRISRWDDSILDVIRVTSSRKRYAVPYPLG